LNIIEAFDFYSEFPAEKFEFSFDVHNSTEETSDLFCEQMKAIGDKALSESGETGLRKISFFDKIFTALDDQVRIENFCGAGKSLLVIDAKNKIFTCPWDVGKKDTLVGEDLSLNESALNTYSRPLIELNDCQQCWARYLCGGGCMYIHEQATGSKNIKSDIFCNRMRTLVMTGILFYKKCRNFEEGTSNEN
jgi:uncharacterized protein